MEIRFISDYAQSIYQAIPGETTRDKVTHVAKQLALCGIGASLYYLSPTRIQDYTPLMALILTRILPSTYHAIPNAYGLADVVRNYSPKLTSPIEKKISSYFLFIATTYSVSKYTIEILNTLFFRDGKGEDIKYDYSRVYVGYSDPNISNITALDQCGLTIGDYFILDHRFKYHNNAPISLKERVGFFLSTKGLKSGEDLVKAGIIGTTADRWAVCKNLKKVLVGNNITQENSPKLPEISERDKFCASLFNIALTASTLSLQMLYAPLMTTLGVAFGVLKQDRNFSYHHPVPLQKEMEQALILYRKEKTALFALTSMTQKCHQVLESWNNVAIAVFSPKTEAIGCGIAQGQTLAAYWNDYRGYTVTPAPTERNLLNGYSGAIQQAMYRRLTQPPHSAEKYQ